MEAVEIQESPDHLVLRQSRDYLNPFLILSGVVLFSLPLGAYWQGIRSPDQFVEWVGHVFSAKDRTTALGGFFYQLAFVSGIWAIPLVFVIGSLTMAIPALRDRTIAISKTDATVLVSDAYPLGIERSYELSDVEMFYPVNGRLFAMFRVGDELDEMFLLDVSPKDFELVGRMNASLPGIPWPPP